MPINQNPGRIVGANVTPQTYGASGEWSLNQQFQAAGSGTWPLQPLAISRSLRFNSADSAYLNRTPASATNRKTWTWSGWVKRGLFNNESPFSSGADLNNFTAIYFSSDTIYIQQQTAGANVFALQTQSVYRDPSAWYHIVIAVDTTQATAANRRKIYVNGTQITALTVSTEVPLNTDTYFNTTVEQRIGRNRAGVATYFDGYQTEVNFIDGQALTPSSFGFFDLNGIWQAKTYTGTYGNNGFYLTFADNSNTTATTLGKDYSGNGNNWTPNNFSVSAGAGNDSLIDSPTNDLVNTDTGVGGEVRGNYCTLSPFQLAVSGALFTLANGNLDYSCSASAGSSGRMMTKGTMALGTGKIYWEVQVTNTNPYIGVVSEGTFANNGVANGNLGAAAVYNAGQGTSGTTTATYSGTTFTFTTNDIVGFAWDGTALTLGCYKNGSLIGTWSNFESTKTWFPFMGINASASATSAIWNFGQRPFAYTAPSGFKALCSTNLPSPTILNGAQYFAASTYTGNGATQTITNGGNNNALTTFAPDLVWIKSRSAATDNKLTDTVRGATKGLISNTTGAETTDTNGLTAFGVNGFTLGTDTVYNNNTATYVAWQWKAGGTAVTNTAGSITSSVSANTTSGVSVLTYTGTGANATVGHGLGVAPSMIIIKARGAADWYVGHTSIGWSNTGYLILNNTGASGQYGAISVWNTTAPSSTVFSLGTTAGVNAVTPYVAYCFAPVSGFSAFGSYTGNGSTDGPFVYTGFRPRYVLIKRTDSATGGSWVVLDSSRDTYNAAVSDLAPDLAAAEFAGVIQDILSNGFKLRSATSGNVSSGTYIYAAFAENPFKVSRAR